MNRGRATGYGRQDGPPRTREQHALWLDRRQRATREERGKLWAAQETNNRTSFDMFTGYGLQPVGAIRGLGLPTPPCPTGSSGPVGGAGSVGVATVLGTRRGPFDPW